MGGHLGDRPLAHLNYARAQPSHSARPLLNVDVTAAAPDLADVREKYPNLSRLWDAVRHEYWAEVITPQEHSGGLFD